MTADGVPASFRCADGNTGDSVTHIETWNTLRAVAGRADFLYVADSKLCSYDNMQYIHRAGGRFVTVMPRNRQEDGQFRKWIQTQTPDWQLVWDRPNPRHSDGPRDRWYVFQPQIPSIEVWPITWVWSSLLTLHQGARRQRLISCIARQRRTDARAYACVPCPRTRGHVMCVARPKEPTAWSASRPTAPSLGMPHALCLTADRSSSPRLETVTAFLQALPSSPLSCSLQAIAPRLRCPIPD